MSYETYKYKFEVFLERTDEKRVLLEAITPEIGRISAKSLLDIGAGNGLLAIPLSHMVPRYHAIEPNPQFAEQLRAARLEVTQKKFPTETNESYDLVLISHAIPCFGPEEVSKYIDAAWDRVSPKGALVVITNQCPPDNWSQLLDTLNFGPNSRLGRMPTNRQAQNESILDKLKKLGQITTKEIITHVTTQSLEEMINALSFIASNNIPERENEFLEHSSQVRNILQQKYQTSNGFSFPFHHVMIVVNKQNG